MKLSQNPRILLYAAAISLSIIFIAVHGVNYGLDIQGGSWLQLQLEGAAARSFSYNFAYLGK